MNLMICQDCKMVVTPANAYHPQLHCVLWKAYHRDPTALLAKHGYTREPKEANP